RCRFDLRLEPGVVMYHEWRDDSSPYRVGPSIWFRGGKLFVGGKELAVLPLEEWIHVEVAATLGEQSTGTWDLTVTLPGEAPRRFEKLNNGSADWKKLTWLGIISNATESTVFYLDNLKLENKDL
ncbi:MAG: hypothetical protein ACC628_21265, partial [Pirellulaceae bacterium]